MKNHLTNSKIVVAVVLLLAQSAFAQATFVTDCEDKLSADSFSELTDQQNAHTYRMLLERYGDQIIVEEGTSECQALADYFWNLTVSYQDSDNVDKQLVTVDLSNREIESILPIGLLDQYSRENEHGINSEVMIHALDLSHNNLTTEVLDIVDLTKIIVLDLSHNLIGNISFLDGTSLLALRKLILSYNPLEKLELTGSGQAPNLHHLNVAHRAIQDIEVDPDMEDEGFEPVLLINTKNSFPNLITVDMSYCGLVSIESFGSRRLLYVNADAVRFTEDTNSFFVSEPLHFTARYSENAAKVLSSGFDSGLERMVFLDLSVSDVTDSQIAGLFSKRGVQYFVLTGNPQISLEPLEFISAFSSASTANWYAEQILGHIPQTEALAVDSTSLEGFLPDIVVSYFDRDGEKTEIVRISEYEQDEKPFRGLGYLSATSMPALFNPWPEDLEGLLGLTVGNPDHCPAQFADLCRVVSEEVQSHQLFETGLDDVMYRYCEEQLGQPCQDVTFDCANVDWVITPDDSELYQQNCPSA